MCHLLQCIHGLNRAVAGGWGSSNLHGTIFVESRSEFRSRSCLERAYGGKGKHLALLVAHEKVHDVFGLRTVSILGSYIHLPRPTEAVEVIYEQGAHESAQGTVYILYFRLLSQECSGT